LPELSSAGEVEGKLSAGLNAGPGAAGAGTAVPACYDPAPVRPRGWFPILDQWVPAGEFDEFNAHRRADPGCVRVSLHQRVA